MKSPKGSIEQWGMFETSLKGPARGNPFVDVELPAVFSNGPHKVEVTGFYDGGAYRVRFMHEHRGQWSYRTRSCSSLRQGTLGFDGMDKASDDRYLQYCLARLTAFRNVWWSMANEFDFMKEKKDSDWAGFLRS